MLDYRVVVHDGEIIAVATHATQLSPSAEITVSALLITLDHFRPCIEVCARRLSIGSSNAS